MKKQKRATEENKIKKKEKKNLCQSNGSTDFPEQFCLFT